jgi:conjugative relaxase-like TrwC/TraI family protein
MLTMSKPLSAAQVRAYHAEEFTNGRVNYYSTGDRIHGQWHGELARRWGLSGDVAEEHVHRLADGQHPLTGERLVEHQTAREYAGAHGEQVKPMAHRAAWDATFSAPKSVSLTALVGGDTRVGAAHRESVRVALGETERFVQARIGRNHPAETTGKWIAATFEHDSARPVDGYAAPQLHTHAVFFNVTQRQNGDTRALQPRELYKSQQYVTAVYRSELAMRLTALGYEVERGDSGQPEIRGYTRAYLEASSPRRQQIKEHLANAQQAGAGAAQIAAHRTREAKLGLAHDQMQHQHREMAEAFGGQPARVVEEAMARAHRMEPQPPRLTAHAAVTFAKERNMERDAVVDERALLRDALTRSMGHVTVTAMKGEFERRVAAGEFVAVTQPPGIPGRAVTTREMIDLERDTIQLMRQGQHTQSALAGVVTRETVERAYPHLNEGQRAAVEHILTNRDQVVALEGVAGGGKTTALAAVRDAAEREGYQVQGFAPTSRAAQKLEEAGITSSTLQRHLTGREESHDGRQRLYVLDESSLASTRQMHEFVRRLTPRDRVLLVGDVRQHQGVEAGRPYQQLQEMGIDTVRLDEIVRQKDPALKAVVERLARGQVREAIQSLDGQGRVHHIVDRDERLRAIARVYASDPVGTLVVSPDNDSRREINQAIHRLRQTEGQVDQGDHRVRVLVPRQDLTGADRQWAEQYKPGDVVRYSRGSKVLSIKAGEYARVDRVDAQDNLLAVTRNNGAQVTYDPRRLQGVTLYREADRTFATGDRIQFTAPDRERHVANRELGTIDRIESTGHLHLRLDSGRTLAFRLDDQPHLDYGYAVTSHSSQGQTADRVLLHLDTERAGEHLVNRRLAYVALSRGRYDAHIYTNDKAQLGEALNRESSQRAAIEPNHRADARGQTLEPSGPRGLAAQPTMAHSTKY